MSEGFLFINFGVPFSTIFIDRFVNSILDKVKDRKTKVFLKKQFEQIKASYREEISRKFIRFFQQYLNIEDNEIRENIADFNSDFKQYFESKTSMTLSDFDIIPTLLNKNFSNNLDTKFYTEFEILFDSSMEDYYNELINFLDQHNLDSSQLKLDIIMEYSKKKSISNQEVFRELQFVVENMTKILEHLKVFETKPNFIEEILNDSQTYQYHPGDLIPALRCRSVKGRDDMVHKMTEYFSEENTKPIVTIHGGPGYGKTEVAQLISKQCLEEKLFNDVFWIKARKTEFTYGMEDIDSPKNLMLLDNFLEELAIQLRIPKVKIPNYLQFSKDLIVLDNAEDAEVSTIFNYLIQFTNKNRVLVTNRQYTPGPYIHPTLIPGLSLKWTRELLNEEATLNNITALLSASEENIEEIHKRTLGAPLAIHFVISRAKNEGTIHAVLDDLKEANKNVWSFYKFCFESAWKDLSEVSKNLLRHLGFFSDKKIKSDEFLGTWEVSQSDFYSSINQLSSWHLLESEYLTDSTILLDLHPWIRTSIRTNLIDSWTPSNEDLKKITKWKTKAFSEWK